MVQPRCGSLNRYGSRVRTVCRTLEGRVGVRLFRCSHCALCARRPGLLPAVGVLHEPLLKTAPWQLAPVVKWRSWEDERREGYWREEYTPGPRVAGAAVPLTCPRCGRSCGSWRPETLAARLPAVDGYIVGGGNLLVPDLPDARVPNEVDPADVGWLNDDLHPEARALIQSLHTPVPAPRRR